MIYIMYTLAKISKNAFNCIDFEKGDWKEYVELITASDNDELMKIIVTTIAQTPDDIGDTAIILETYDNIYQMCYLDKEKNNKSVNENDINGVASNLILNKNKVYGDVVLIKTRLNEHYMTEADHLDIDEVNYLLDCRINNMGLLIRVDGTVDEFRFNNSPLENRMDGDNWRMMEMDLFKFRFNLYFQKNPSENIINKIVTRFVGDRIIHGDCLIIIKATENDYGFIDKELFSKIDTVCWDYIINRRIAQEPESKVDGQIPVIDNGYTVVRKRYNKYKDKYNENYIYVCKGCYREKYIDKITQKIDWKYHKSDCLYELEPYHVLLENEK